MPITTTTASVDDHSRKSCAHNFDDSRLEIGRMVAVLPTLHPTYKISFEFLVSSAGAGWENIIHFTKDDVNDGHTCNQRQIALWTAKNGTRLQFYVSGCVNGAEKVIHPEADINTWNSIVFGEVHFTLYFNEIAVVISVIKLKSRIFISKSLNDRFTYEPLKL